MAEALGMSAEQECPYFVPVPENACHDIRKLNKYPVVCWYSLEFQHSYGKLFIYI